MRIATNRPTPASYWSYQAPPAPDYSMVPAAAFSGTREQWEALSPGMRREIVRTWEKTRG